MPAGPTAHTAASCPVKALVRDSRLYSVLTTGMLSGNVDLDSVRVMIVTSKPACVRAEVMGVPKLPEA